MKIIESVIQKLKLLRKAPTTIKEINAIKKITLSDTGQQPDIEKEFRRNLVELHSREIEAFIMFRSMDLIDRYDNLLTNAVVLKNYYAKSESPSKSKEFSAHLNKLRADENLGAWFRYFDSLIQAKIDDQALKEELKKRSPSQGYKGERQYDKDTSDIWKKILEGLEGKEIIDLFKDNPTELLLFLIKSQDLEITKDLLTKLDNNYDPKKHAKGMLDLMIGTRNKGNKEEYRGLLKEYIKNAKPESLKISLEANLLTELVKNPEQFTKQREAFKELYAVEKMIQNPSSPAGDAEEYDFVNDFNTRYNAKLSSLTQRLSAAEGLDDGDNLKIFKEFYKKYQFLPYTRLSEQSNMTRTIEKMNFLNILKNRLDLSKDDTALEENSRSFAEKYLESRDLSQQLLRDFIANAEPEILKNSLETLQIERILSRKDYYEKRKELVDNNHRLIKFLEHTGDLINVKRTQTYDFLRDEKINEQKTKIQTLIQSEESAEDSTALKVFRQIIKDDILTIDEIMAKYSFPDNSLLEKAIKVTDQFLKDLKNFDTSSDESKELISHFIKRISTLNSKMMMTEQQKKIPAEMFLQSKSPIELNYLIRQLYTGSPPYSDLFQETQHVLTILKIAKQSLVKTSGINLYDIDHAEEIKYVDAAIDKIKKDTLALSNNKEGNHALFGASLGPTKLRMTKLLEKYNNSINLYNADPSNNADPSKKKDLMVFPKERKSLSEEARDAAINVADSALEDSGSFWNLAEAARRAKPITSTEKSLTNIVSEARLQLESTIKQQEESLLLEMFKWCANDIKIFTTSKPNKYPGPGFVVKGIDIPRALGIENENHNEYIKSLERDILPNYTKDGTIGKYYGVFSNMEESELYFTRGFIAIVPPGYKPPRYIPKEKEELPLRFRIPTGKYPIPPTPIDKYPEPETDEYKRLAKKIEDRHREHYSYVVFNDHFGREEGENKIQEMAYLIPTVVLKELTDPYLKKYDFDKNNDLSYKSDLRDFSEAKITVSDFKRKAKEKGFNILNLTAPTNYGSLANAFPVKAPPYHTWEHDRQNESSDNDAGHIHNTHIRGGYVRNPFYLMDHLWPLQEAEQIVEKAATGVQAIFDAFKIMRSYYTRGLSKHDPCIMLNEARKIHDSLTANNVINKNQYPVLCVSDMYSNFDLSQLPDLNLYLDTFDMTIYDKRNYDENNKKKELAYPLKSGSGFQEQEIFKDLFIKPNNYLHQHLLFYPRQLFEKYTQELPKFDDRSYLNLINKYLDEGLIK